MSFEYICRHCGHTIGRIDKTIAEEVINEMEQFTSSDWNKMMEYMGNGDVRMKVICENCEHSLNEHPQYYELDYFIH